MAAAGFGEVGACPAPKQHLASLGMSWEVIVVDDGPYPCGMAGLRQADAVERRARAIARAHGGFWCGGSTGPKYGSLEQSAPPILRLSPGSRPAVPPLAAAAAPPPGDFALTPDTQPLRQAPPDLASPVNWEELSHAYGTAADLPARFSGMLLSDRDWGEEIGELAGCLLHQGSCYPSTGPALTVLARLITADALTAARRRDVYLLLLTGADCWRDDLILDADCAAALARPARPGAWAGEVREAVGGIVPPLLGRWATEPPGNQVTLAALAAVFPRHGEGLCDLIAALAAKQARTQAGAYAHLACLLIAGDSVAALTAARDIYGWHDGLTAFDIDNELVEPGMRAERVLSDAVTATVAVVRP